MTDQDTSLAARLRRARESRGVTLDQAHQSTGISLKVLRGLEAGSTDVVEHIFMRLTLVAYAEYLGLDTVEMAAMFEAEAGPATATEVYEAPASSPGHGPVKMGAIGALGRVSSSQLILAGVALLLVLVLIAAWLDLDLSFGGSEPPPPPEARPVRMRDVSADHRPVVDKSVLSPGIVAADDGGGEVIRTSAGDGEPADTADDQPVGLWDPSSVAPPPALALEALAVDTTWVQVLWDGAGGLETTMVTGERRQWAARDSFFVRSGIAHGVHFTFEGQLLGDGRLGDPDEVLRFHASRAGVVLLGRNLRPLGEPIPLASRDGAAREVGGGDAVTYRDSTGRL